jgi:hypothetical protein
MSPLLLILILLLLFGGGGGLLCLWALWRNWNRWCDSNRANRSASHWAIMNVVAAKPPLKHTGKAIESTYIRLLCKPSGGRVFWLAGRINRIGP